MDSTVIIKLHEVSNKIPKQIGVRQGDILLKLFTEVLEEVFKNLNYETKVIQINGEFLNKQACSQPVQKSSQHENSNRKEIKKHHCISDLKNQDSQLEES